MGPASAELSQSQGKAEGESPVKNQQTCPSLAWILQPLPWLFTHEKEEYLLHKEVKGWIDTGLVGLCRNKLRVRVWFPPAVSKVH